MLIQFLRGIKPGVSLTLGMLFIIAWMISGRSTDIAPVSILSLNIPPSILLLFQGILIIGLGLWLNNLVIESQLLNRSQSYTLAFFLLLYMGIPGITVHLKYTLALYPIVFALQQLFGSYYQSFPSLAVFNASLGFGLAALLAPEYLPFLLVVPVTMISFGHIEWRLWFIWVLGLCSIFVMAYMLGLHLIFIEHPFHEVMIAAVIDGVYVPSLGPWELVILVFDLGLFIWAFIELIFNLGKKKIFNRKLFHIQIAMILLSLIAFAFSPPKDIGSLVALAIPSSMILANLFHYFFVQRWFDLLLLFWLILIVSGLFFS